MSEWKNNVDALTLSAGVDVRIGADGEAEFGKESSGCQGYLMSVNHMAAFCSELTEGIGDAHTAGLADNQGKTDELRQMARAVAESQVKVAKAELKQQKDLLDARLRALGEDTVEDAAEPEAEEPAEEEADEEEEEIDLIINVEVDKRGEEVHTEVRMKVSTLKKAIKKPTVTLLHALKFALQQNEQIYLHGGFGNSMVLEKTGGDMDAVVPVIARFHKNQGPFQMKLGAVYRTDVATLFEASSIYTCKLTMAEKDDVDLKYMISGLVVEYDPIDADRRSPSPKRKAEGEGNGARDSEFVIADRVVWCSAERRKSRSYGPD